MRISQINDNIIAEFLRLSFSPEMSTEFSVFKTGAINFVCSYTGLTKGEIDEKEDLAVVVLILIGEMYENRTWTVDGDKINPIAKAILDLHGGNYL